MLIIEIILIIFITFAGISIVLTSMKTGISPSPSSGKTYRAIAKATENSGTGTKVIRVKDIYRTPVYQYRR